MRGVDMRGATVLVDTSTVAHDSMTMMSSVVRVAHIDWRVTRCSLHVDDDNETTLLLQFKPSWAESYSLIKARLRKLPARRRRARSFFTFTFYPWRRSLRLRVRLGLWQGRLGTRLRRRQHSIIHTLCTTLHTSQKQRVS